MSNYILVFLILMVCGLGVFAVVSGGYFPAAFVNARMIEEWKYEKSAIAAANYYANFGKFTQKTELTDLVKDEKEIRRMALEQIIEDRLIGKELERRLGDSYDGELNTKLAAVLEKPELKKASETLYGVEYEELLELFLKPTAERELLDEKLKAENTDLAAWLSDAKSSASVHLFVPGFSWQDGQVAEN